MAIPPKVSNQDAALVRWQRGQMGPLPKEEKDPTAKTGPTRSCVDVLAVLQLIPHIMDISSARGHLDGEAVPSLCNIWAGPKF